LFTSPVGENNHLLTILSYWEKGIWNNALLVFAYQMMLILVLGHILVLSSPLNTLIGKLTQFVHSTASAVILVSVTTMMVSFFNWGLGLIFGAILARKVAESAQNRGFAINYPLVGASGYVGLMIWHGGISGSAPLKVAESGHIQGIMSGLSDPTIMAQLPDSIAFDQTVLSTFNLSLFAILLVLVPTLLFFIAKRNLSLFAILLVLVPTLLFFIAKRAPTTPTNLPIYSPDNSTKTHLKGAEKLDQSNVLGIGFGLLVMLAFFYRYWDALGSLSITPNLLNFFMLGLAFLLHKNFKNFLHALEEAIKGATGILIQFPLYFGIMGIMRESGMVVDISDFFVSISTTQTLPIFTFISAGLVNIFVPSGGGQWAIQGPIVIESALKLGVGLPKAIMALSYGDQITNMLQPFWALPLLGITKLKAREILPYTLLLMLLGSIVYIVGLLLV